MPFIAAISMSCCAQGNQISTDERIFEVDRLGTGPYKTLASVAKLVKPGDTIRIKAGTGPYREILMIRTSGTENAPIVIDGGGNTITAFDPISNWEEKDGVVSCHLKAFPCVLAYHGERLVQDANTGQFTKYADLNDLKDTLTLRPGVSKEGWEYSARALAVGVSDASYLTFRNINASGSTNDGFNLHGSGVGLVFENIEGFQNLDEGFSTHDSIDTVVRGAKFWGNDNGIANSYVDKDVVSSTFINTDCHDNLGFGLVLHDCKAVLKNVRLWNNGIQQLRLNSAIIDLDKVEVYPPKWNTRQLMSYTESKTSRAVIPFVKDQVVITGTPPMLEAGNAPIDLN